ncbi:uncharacterized protein LOC127127466 [Lathyrus oleraceus]|uniref:uncharacterized protein LOC127127466 n=1 Tax=Pisum sativum TaxID=3888 RepID=UPI0021D156B4|nr:uncharacterized protein LOC127127466 [Pisum sativum]XP_050912613.1 uncharacterized protein LOC127127466 [Pisum sativum]
METNGEEFVRILEQKLKGLNITVMSHEDYSEDNNDNHIDQLSDMFANLDISNIEINNNNSINPVYSPRPIEKYYYKRPSPQDLLFEESEPFQNSYSGKAIYEWNVDGLNDKQIIDTIHRMIMYSTVCKQHGNSDSSIASFITTGFVGQLRGWWDHYLTESQKLEILNHKKIVKNEPRTSTSTVVAMTTTGEEDAVYTLCLSILQHFVGTNVPIGEKIQTLLQNLRCPSLTHFRWYKDTFLSRVYQLNNPNSLHWKAKFIDGLPHFFSEKIRQSLRQKNDGININYSDLTYGQIISTCVNEGLNLCNDIKLRNQLKKQKLSEKHQLGEFCEQFAFDLGKSPDNKKKKGKIFRNKPYRDKPKNSYKNSYKNKKRSHYNKSRPKEKSFDPKGKRKAKRLDITCHKCGKSGHYANQCWTKKALNEIEDEQLRSQLEKVLLLNSDSEDYSSEEDINIIYESSSDCSSESSNNNNCQCNQLDYWKSIVDMNGLNVLTSEQDEAIKAIESISDTNLKRKMLEVLIQENSRKESPVITEAPYQLSEVLSRFRQSNIRETPVSIMDLNREINLLKNEIAQIKKENHGLSQRLTFLESNNSKIEEIASTNNPSPSDRFLSLIDRVTSQKWFVRITLVINRNFILENEVALIDSGTDLNCLQEGIIPTKYFDKTTQSLTQAGGDKLTVNYKLSNAYICNKDICLPTHFILVKNLTHRIILGTPFLHKIMPLINVDQKGITSIINNKRITFEFITDPHTRMINEVKDILLKKKNKFVFLKKKWIY